MHQGLEWEDNLMRLVDATSHIKPVNHKFHPSLMEEKNIFQSVIGVAVIEKLAKLETGFGELIRVKGGYAGFGGAEGAAAQPLFLVLVEKHMIGHNHLGAVGDQQPGLYATVGQGVHLTEKFSDFQSHAVADDIGDVVIKNTGGKLVQGKPAESVDDGMSGVTASLKTDNNVRLGCQNVGDFTLAFVAPIGAYDCSYHGNILL